MSKHGEAEETPQMRLKALHMDRGRMLHHLRDQRRQRLAAHSVHKSQVSTTTTTTNGATTTVQQYNGSYTATFESSIPSKTNWESPGAAGEN